MKASILKSLFIIPCYLLSMSLIAQSDYNWSDYDYKLNFELDSRTGTYKPAYTYKANSGNSTIWLDGANKKNKNEAALDGNQKYLLQFELPAGWTIDKNAFRAKAISKDSTSFTIFESRINKGTNFKSDFKSEWDNRLKARFGDITLSEIIQNDYLDKGKYCFVIKSKNNAGIAFIVIYQDGRAIPVILDYPSVAAYKNNKGLMTGFIKSIKLLKAKVEMSKSPNQK